MEDLNFNSLITTGTTQPTTSNFLTSSRRVKVTQVLNQINDEILENISQNPIKNNPIKNYFKKQSIDSLETRKRPKRRIIRNFKDPDDINDLMNSTCKLHADRWQPLNHIRPSIEPVKPYNLIVEPQPPQITRWDSLSPHVRSGKYYVKKPFIDRSQSQTPTLPANRLLTPTPPLSKTPELRNRFEDPKPPNSRPAIRKFRRRHENTKN